MTVDITIDPITTLPPQNDMMLLKTLSTFLIHV